MKTAIIFHGTGGYPEENWFPWLKTQLEKLGYCVFVPRFPDPGKPDPKIWLIEFGKYEKHLDSDTILIGHSLGGAFLLRVLEKIPVNIAAAFFVSAPIGILPIKYYESDKPFIGAPFDWQQIRQKANAFFVFHSDNDELVCLGNGQELAKNLSVSLTIVPNAGHFNTNAGYTKFELLFEKIKKEL